MKIKKMIELLIVVSALACIVSSCAFEKKESEDKDDDQLIKTIDLEGR